MFRALLIVTKLGLVALRSNWMMSSDHAGEIITYVHHSVLYFILKPEIPRVPSRGDEVINWSVDEIYLRKDQPQVETTDEEKNEHLETDDINVDLTNIDGIIGDIAGTVDESETETSTIALESKEETTQMVNITCLAFIQRFVISFLT